MTTSERITLDVQYRQGQYVEKYIIEGEPGIHYEVIEEKP